MEVSLYADGTAEKGGDPIYRHRLSLAGPAQKAVTPVDMAYFSTTPYPQKCRNKSYLLRNKKGFIIFSAGEKLCRHMSAWLPEPYERVFAAADDGYEARRRQRARRRAEKRQKRRKN